MFIQNFISKLINISKYSVCAGLLLVMNQEFFATPEFKPKFKPTPISSRKNENKASVTAFLIKVQTKPEATKPAAIKAGRKISNINLNPKPVASHKLRFRINPNRPSLRPKAKPGWPH